MKKRQILSDTRAFFNTRAADNVGNVRVSNVRRSSLPICRMLTAEDANMLLNTSPSQTLLNKPPSQSLLYKSINSIQSFHKRSSLNLDKDSQGINEYRKYSADKGAQGMHERRKCSTEKEIQSMHERRKCSNESQGLNERRKYSNDKESHGTNERRQCSNESHGVKERRKGSNDKESHGILDSISGLLGKFHSKPEIRVGETDEDIDFLVSLYGRSSVDSGYQDSARSSKNRFSACMVKEDTASVFTFYCRNKNILQIKLHSTNMESWLVDESKKLYAKFSFLPDKSQTQKTKALAFQKKIIWDEDVQFCNLTMKQLETGSISVKFLMPSKFGISKKCIAKTRVELKRHDYRTPNRIFLIFENIHR